MKKILYLKKLKFFEGNLIMASTISNIRVLPISGRDNCVAIVSFTLFDSLNLTGIKLFRMSNNQKYVIYPTNPGSKSKVRYVYPVSEKLRQTILTEVWKEYEKTVSDK